MTLSSQQKRLDKIEVQLTPKEWAIRMADEIRMHPSGQAYVRALAEGSIPDPKSKAYAALRKQAEESHPGKKPEDMRACNKSERKLFMELHTLEVLMAQVNETILSQTENAVLAAALNLSKLHSLILQDAFGRIVKKARWVLTNRLSPESDFLPKLPWLIEDWRQDMMALIADAFYYEAAVRVVQDQCFDGHPILGRDVEARLAEAVKIIEDGVATFNDYLKTGEWKEPLAIDIEIVKSRQDGFGLADQWMKTAKYYGVVGYLEGAEHDSFVRDALREMCGVVK